MRIPRGCRYVTKLLVIRPTQAPLIPTCWWLLLLTPLLSFPHLLHATLLLFFLLPLFPLLLPLLLLLLPPPLLLLPPWMPPWLPLLLLLPHFCSFALVV